MHRLQRQWIIKYCDDAETVTAAAAAVMQLSAAANSVIAVARPTSAITTSLAFAYGFHIDIDTASLPDRWSSLFSDYEVDYNSNHATMPRHAERNAATFRSSIAHILTEACMGFRPGQTGVQATPPFSLSGPQNPRNPRNQVSPRWRAVYSNVKFYRMSSYVCHYQHLISIFQG